MLICEEKRDRGCIFSFFLHFSIVRNERKKEHFYLFLWATTHFSHPIHSHSNVIRNEAEYGAFFKYYFFSKVSSSSHFCVSCSNVHVHVHFRVLCSMLMFIFYEVFRSSRIDHLIMFHVSYSNCIHKKQIFFSLFITNSNNDNDFILNM